MTILGISAFYHDSAAALVKDGVILAAIEEEKLSRKKHDASFPEKAIAFCLNHAGLKLSQLDAIVFYDKPFLKFERLIETYYAYAPKGFISFLKAMPLWVKEKFFLKRLIRNELKKIEPGFSVPKIFFTEHHLSHAASAYYPSGFEEAAIITIDGVGEWATTTICKGKGNQIQVLKQMNFPDSVGLLYSAFTYYLGFKVNSGEYKLMGLAPYGDTNSAELTKYISLIKNELLILFDDGSVKMNLNYFNYPVGLTMVKDQKFEKLFSLKKRNPDDEITMSHCNLALAIQTVTEEIVLKIANHVKQLTGSENLCLAGGVALNCVANGKLENSGLFKNIFIQPAAGDAGGAMGAALAMHSVYFSSEKKHTVNNINADYGLGPLFNTDEIINTAKKFNAVFEIEPDNETLFATTAKLIREGMAVGWYRGRTEFGPRALGNRSILADARNAAMQQTLNLKIKFRESFRPFAPAILAEQADTYFEMKGASPYMLLVQPLKKEFRNVLPENYSSYSIKEKLIANRGIFPAITHVDYSARVQTVHQEINPDFHRLLSHFYQQTGCPLVINTSFNVRGEPIVNTPDEAYTCFMNTGLDVLVMENFIFYKTHQPELAAAFRKTKFEDD